MEVALGQCNTIYLTAGAAPGIQRLLRKLYPQHSSHSLTGMEPWERGELVIEGTHTFPENKEHFVTTQRGQGGLGSAEVLCDM